MSSTKLARLGATAILGFALALGGSLPAIATPVTSVSGSDSGTGISNLSSGETETRTFTDAKCLADAIGEADSSRCSVSSTIELGEASAVSVTSIQKDPGLSSAAKAELLLAAQSSTVRTNTWAQFTTALSYTTRQNGRFYYNGSRVWVTQSYGGSVGFHSCGLQYVLPGWTVNGFSKSDSGNLSTRYLYCRWNVTEFPAPLVRSVDMTATLRANGTISGFWASVG